jgi:hypothetical protein
MAIVIALLATVGMLITMGFFMLGSLPLLVLKHDTPLDARFIRGLFAVYYMAVMVTAGVATPSYALAGKPEFGLGTGCILAIAFLLRRVVLSRMDALRATMTETDKLGISRFRRLHVAGMVLNGVQLGASAWGLTFLKL